MDSNFDKLMANMFACGIQETNQIDRLIDKKIISEEFKDILDRMATELVFNTFDDKRLIEAIAALPKFGRIVLVFYIVLDMEMSEIAYLLDTSLESVYVQKSKAIKKLREYMNSH